MKEINGRSLFDKIQELVSLKVGDAKEHTYYTGNIVIDLPRKKGQYHGSSFVIKPAHCYDIDADAITSTEDANKIISELKENKCDITDVHEYLKEMNIMRDKERLEDQSHIHFKCRHKGDDDVMKILRLFPELK